MNIGEIRKENPKLYDLIMNRASRSDLTDEHYLGSAFVWDATPEKSVFWGLLSGSTFKEFYKRYPEWKQYSSTQNVMESIPISNDRLSIGDFIVTEKPINFNGKSLDGYSNVGSVYRIIDIEELKFWVSRSEYFYNLEGVPSKYKVFKGEREANVYSYELLNPVKEEKATSSKPQDVRDECYRIFKAGDMLRSIGGTKFVVPLGFKIDILGDTHVRLVSSTGGSIRDCDGHGLSPNVAFIDEGAVTYAEIISKVNAFPEPISTPVVKNTIKEALAICEEKYKVGDTLMNRYGCEFTIDVNSFRIRYCGEEVQYVNALDQRFTVYSLEDDLYAEIVRRESKANIIDIEAEKLQRRIAFDRVRSICQPGRSIRTYDADEFDLDVDGDFGLEIDETDDCIYLVDEDGSYFNIYSFSEGILPIVIDHHPFIQVKPMPNLTPSTTDNKDVLEDVLDLLKVKSITII